MQMFVAELQWCYEPGPFNHTQSVRSWAYLSEVARPLFFILPPMTRSPQWFRLVLAPAPHSVEIGSIELSSAQGTKIWSCSPRSVDVIGFGEDSVDSELPRNLLQVHGSVLELQGLPDRNTAFAEATRLELTLLCAAEGGASNFDRQIEAEMENDSTGSVSISRSQLRFSASALRQMRSEFTILSAALGQVYSSKSWRWTLPLRKALRWTTIYKKRALKRRIKEGFVSVKAPAARIHTTVDVILPIYRGLAEARRCFESLRNSRNQTNYELIVINDCSPEPELSEYVRTLARNGEMTLIEHERNCGYTATVCEGMRLHPDRDVVLLNSDIEVCNDWLDRLVAAAYSKHHIATVTPFSNNATLCSYPAVFEENDLPTGWSCEQLDAAMSKINSGKTVEIPTGVGFCMYIRRACLNDIGLYDVTNFPGYGEENDFCLRAAKRGWSHVLAADTFVYHAGQVSFGRESAKKQAKALAKLNLLYPHYAALISQHAQKDPAYDARTAVDLHRLEKSSKRRVLFILPELSGGTERHVKDLSESLGANWECLRLKVSRFLLEVFWTNQNEAMNLAYEIDTEYDDALMQLKSLGIERLHIHSALNSEKIIRRLVRDLALPFDFTVHDFHTICPQIKLSDESKEYCGQPDEKGCNRCLAVTPPLCGTRDIRSWRQQHAWLLRESERIFVPSHDTAQRMHKYFLDTNFVVTPHPDQQRFGPYPSPVAVPLKAGENLRIAVLGALSEEKGADLLEDAARDAVASGLPLEFHLLGYAYRPLTTRPKANLVIYGGYDDRDLSAILAQLQPHVVWFPARWPETYSYTLSACLQSALPVVAPDIGAFPERLVDRQWTWVEPWMQTAQGWNQFFVTIAHRHFKTGDPPPIHRGRKLTPAFSYESDYGLPLQTGPLISGEMKMAAAKLDI